MSGGYLVDSCILFFYGFNSNLIVVYLNLKQSYVYIFNEQQEQLRWCGAIKMPILFIYYYLELVEVVSRLHIRSFHWS